MVVLKLADEVYELQGWEPPAKKQEIASKNRSINMPPEPAKVPPLDSHERKRNKDPRE